MTVTAIDLAKNQKVFNITVSDYSSFEDNQMINLYDNYDYEVSLYSIQDNGVKIYDETQNEDYSNDIEFEPFFEISHHEAPSINAALILVMFAFTIALGVIWYQNQVISSQNIEIKKFHTP